nr:hypothetical protein [Clostridia bacterium]
GGRMDEFMKAHLGDLVSRCDKGECGVSAFLNPAEQFDAQRYLKSTSALAEIRLSDDGRILAKNGSETDSDGLVRSYADGGFIFWGGYGDAERKRLFTFPAYLFYTASDIGTLMEAFDEAPVTAVSAKGSGFVKLGHRDYMGALLGAGLKRESLGDIAASDPDGNISEYEAVIFTIPSVAKWLCEDIEAPESIGRDKVKFRPAAISDTFGSGREYKRIDGVIASPRIDCVCALLCGLSREKAKIHITSGAVQLNYGECTSPDREINEGDIISVRGSGRFRIETFDGRTKKDRLRISAVKYI